MVTSRHIEYLRDKLECCHGYSCAELYEWHDQFIDNKFNKSSLFKWKDRYNTLKQSTQFFRNIAVIDDILWNSTSVEEFKVNVDLINIPVEIVNFIICYIWMRPGRCFSQDWNKCSSNYSDMSLKENNAWHIVDTMHAEIEKRNLPMLEVEEFLKLKL